MNLITQIEITPAYLKSQGLSDNFLERFLAKVNKTETCWLWTACINDDGYGFIGKEGGKSTKAISAHRASWLIHRGPIPPGVVVRHRCPVKPVPSCVNPDHLCLGTKGQNTQDAVGLIKDAGGAHWNARLTVDQIAEIRLLCSSGIPNVEIGRRFGVSPHHISKIKHLKCWLHTIPPPSDGSGWEI